VYSSNLAADKQTDAAMLEGTRRWFRRNRTRFAIGAGTLGLVYLAGQYAWSKWLEARQRMADETMSKEK
jgi:peroxin-3